MRKKIRQSIVFFILLLNMYCVNAMELEEYKDDQDKLNSISVEQLEQQLAKSKKTLKGLNVRHALEINQLRSEREKQYKKNMQWLTGTHCVYFLTASLLQIGDPRILKSPQPSGAWQPHVAALCSLVAATGSAMILTSLWN